MNHAPVSRRLGAVLGPTALALLAGCSTLPASSASETLRQSVIDSVKRTLDEHAALDAPRPRQSAPEPTEALGLSASRVEELAELAGPESYAGTTADLGPNLLGLDSAETHITLAEAIGLALRADRAQASRLAPPISEAELIRAEAAFDWVLFANLERSFTDQQQPVPIVGMVPVGTGLSRSDQIAADTGLRKRLTTGGTLELSANLNSFNNATPGFSRSPDPASTASLDVVLNQPLLRNFGPRVALADIRLAEDSRDDAYEATRGELISLLSDVAGAYWTLRFSRERLLVRERLLARGIETREALRGRYGFDVTDAELADAAARVESRRADVIRAQAALRDASDRLKRLIADADRSLLDESVLVASDAPITVAVSYDLKETAVAALERRPDVRRALLRVRSDAVREGVADNAVLPQLDLFVRLSAIGLERDVDDAFDEAFDQDFVDSAVGLSFELPHGNREAKARQRAARLRTLQTAIEYRDTVRSAIEDIKVALRTVETNYRLTSQTTLARIAAAENLRALLVEEETTRGLTPDFLNLKLNRQEALALAETEEALARSEYARAIADASRALALTLEQNGVQVDPDALADEADAALNTGLRGLRPIER